MTGEQQPTEAQAPPEPRADEAPAADAFQLALPVFQGPLDLLLHLIEREELDITEVSLLEVTEQYLRHLRAAEQMDLGAMAEFIAVGARLLLLKSRALLPRDDTAAPDDEDDEGDIRALVEALKEYRRFKQAAEYLRERETGHASYRREVPPPDVPLPSGLDTVTLQSLVDVIREVLERLPEQEPEGEVPRERVRLRDRISRLVDLLETAGQVSFRSMILAATSRTMVIVDFMAVLELIKQRYLEARQGEAFGDIELVRIEGARRPEIARLEEDFTGA